MAVIKLGLGFDAIVGKQGGTIFQVNNGMQISRNRVSFAKQKQGRMMAQIQKQSTLASTWKTLSDGDRASWSAAAPSFPRTNKVGDPLILSGYALFLSLNGVLKYYLGTANTTAPAPSSLDSLTNFDFGTVNTSTIEIVTDTASINADYVSLAISKPYPNGTLPSRPRFVRRTTLTADGSQTTDLINTYRSVFGSPISGMSFFVEAKVVSRTTGQCSTPVIIGNVFP